MKFLHPSGAGPRTKGFKCGVVREDTNASEAMVARRRKQYGEAIRQKLVQPKSAEQYIGEYQY